MIVNKLKTSQQSGLSLNENQFDTFPKPILTLVGFSNTLISFMVLFLNYFKTNKPFHRHSSLQREGYMLL